MTKYAQDMKRFIMNKKYKSKLRQYRRTKYFEGGNPVVALGTVGRAAAVGTGARAAATGTGVTSTTGRLAATTRPATFPGTAKSLSAKPTAKPTAKTTAKPTAKTTAKPTGKEGKPGETGKEGKPGEAGNATDPDKQQSAFQEMKRKISDASNGAYSAVFGTPEQRQQKKLEKAELASKKLSDRIALKSAVSGLPQINVAEKSGKSNERGVVEIVKTASIILQTFFNIIPMIVYFIALYILAMAYLNMILYIFSIVYYFFRTNDSTILYDTLRYKLLSYVFIIKEYSNIDEKDIDGYESMISEINQNLSGQCSLSSNVSKPKSDTHTHTEGSSTEGSSEQNSTTQYSPEPVFFLFNVNFALVLINIIYTLLLVIFIVCFIVVLILKIIVPFFNPNFKTDSWEDNNGNNVFITVATNFYTYVGLIFAIILYFMYRLYFRDFMYKKLHEIKKHIKELDVLIFKTLSVGGQNINKELIQIMDEKKKGNSNGQYSQVNDIVYSYLESGNLQKALQSIFYFTLYSNLHDNIPDTNRQGIEKINKFFFQNQDDFDKSLTYTSLNLNSNGVIEVKKIYLELDIFANKSKYTSQITNIEALQSQIECKIDELNRKITELPEIKNTSLLFGVFIVMIFIFCILFIMSYNLIVIKNEKANNKDSLSFIAKSVNNLLIAQFPQLGAYYLSMINKEESAICTGLARDSSSQFYNSYAKCMSQTVNIKR